MKIAIGTRFWGVNTEKDSPRISSFIEAGKKIGDVFVAVNAAKDKIGTLEMFPEVAFPVTPWGKFVMPLNALVLKAALAGANHLLLASAEFAPTEDQVDHLLQHMGGGSLVAGAKFAEHEFHPGEEVEGTGTTVPWNTFALWNLETLSRIGFPLVGDSPLDPAQAGVEEVATIATFQSIWHNQKAYLVRTPEIGGEWNTTGWSDDRLAKHMTKIESKKTRPAKQLGVANLAPPTVIHIG